VASVAVTSAAMFVHGCFSVATMAPWMSRGVGICGWWPGAALDGCRQHGQRGRVGDDLRLDDQLAGEDAGVVGGGLVGERSDDLACLVDACGSTETICAATRRATALGHSEQVVQT
jgi:hypothetical protein